MALPITNRGFLRAVFGSDCQDAIVASFMGDPGAAAREAWQVWPAGQLVPDNASANNYFCISLFHRSPDGRARRRKDLHARTHVIVLDDVGEKLTAGAVSSALGAPSYKLRTSAVSEQWGFILDPPEPNAARVDVLLDGLVRADLNPGGVDPGMKGVTRLVRLPVGRNGKAKYGPAGVACELIEWAPQRTFTIKALAEAIGLGLDTLAIRGPAPGRRRRGATVLPTGSDHVFGLLSDLGRLKHESNPAESKWEITCPCVDTHTGCVDNGAAYWIGGGFKCHHGHCQDRAYSGFIAALDRLAGNSGLRTCCQREFADAEILSRIREHLDGRGFLSRHELDRAALVPRSEIRSLFREHEEQGARSATQRRDLRALREKINRRRRQLGKPTSRGKARKIVVLPPLPSYQPPVPIEQVQEAQRAFLESVMAGAFDAPPAPVL